MGDMNYRVDLNDAALNRGDTNPKISKKDMWEIVNEKVQKQDFEYISQADDLTVSCK